MTKKKMQIELKENAEPVRQSPRHIPLALHEKLKQLLADLQKRDIIEKVDLATAWVHNLVIVEKKGRKLRLCLDPRNLNKYIKRNMDMIPNLDEILAQLHEKTIFTVLDCKDGYWQIELTESSAELCTFNTLWGRYKFKRVPFGISCAPEWFNQKNKENIW